MTSSTKVSFKPLGNRVVVQPDDAEETMSSGGIYIPDTAKEKPQEGQVVATGPGRMTDDGTRGDEKPEGQFGGTVGMISPIRHFPALAHNRRTDLGLHPGDSRC